MDRREIIIDGNRFSDLESFYDEIDRLLTKDLDWDTGHNLDAFNDLLSGGFGVHEFNEPIRIIWVNFEKSKTDLGIIATTKYYEGKIANPRFNSSFFENKLKELKDGNGMTLCDTILEIISSREHIDFIIR